MTEIMIVISWFVNENVHIVCISFDEISLLTVLDSQLYLLDLSFECTAHLLHLHYHLLIGSLSSLLHYLHKGCVYQNCSFSWHWSCVRWIFLSVLRYDAAANFLSLVLELHVKAELLILGLNFDSWNVFDQNTHFQQTH